jgi:hypothetical protein
MMPEQLSAADVALEAAIDIAYDLMVEATTAEGARQYFKAMRTLIAQRSPQQIFAMEVARRLRR